MSLKNTKLLLLSLNPYDIVQCGIDNFSAYTYIKHTDELAKSIESLSDSDRDNYYDFENDYLERISNDSVDMVKMEMTTEV